MDILKVLEEKVEWIALGIAGLWVAWIVYAYGVQSPVTKEIDGRTLTPATIDEFVVSGEQKTLEGKLARRGGLTFSAINFVDDFVARLTSPKAPALNGYVFNSPPALAKTVQVGPTVAPTDNIVQELPKVLPVRMVGGTFGMCQATEEKIVPVAEAIVAAAAAAPAPAGGGVAPGVRGVMVPPPGLMPAVARPVAGNPAQPLDSSIDMIWVSILGAIDPAQQALLFQEAKVPQILGEPCFLEVQVQRIEILPDGTEGKPQFIKPLRPYALPKLKDKEQTAALIAWAGQNQERILRAPFPFKIVQGEQWKLPAAGDLQVVPVNAPPVVPVAQQFDAKAAFQTWKGLKPAEQKKFIESLTMEQRRLLQKEKQEEAEREAAEKRKSKPQPAKTPTKTYRDAQDPRILREMYAQAGEVRMPRPGDSQPPVVIPAPDGAMPPTVAPQPGGDAAGPGVNPNEAQVWGHDITAEPGRTYKYRLRVIVKNPVFGQAAAAKPNLIDVLALPVDPEEGWSDWSSPISIPQTVKMQLVQADQNRDKEVAQFNIWRWQNGQLNATKTPLLTPGDSIGGKDTKAGVDYSTGWIIVNVQKMGNNDYRVTLVNENSRVEIRRLEEDKKNAEYIKLAAQAAQKTER